MTIPSTARKAGPLLGNGATTSFPFTFKVFAASDIAVTIANSLGVETALVLNTDYSVTLNPNQETSPGGTVTYPLSGSPLPVGSRLTIVGAVDYDQPLDLPSGGNYSPLALENQLDRMVMQIQQLREVAGRTLRAPVTSDVDPELPVPQANAVIGWNSGQTALQNIPISDLATAVGYGTFRNQVFTGDGVTTTFALAEDPIVLSNLMVSVDGVTYVPSVDFTLASGSLVFTVAPTNGAEILARYGEALVALAVDATNIVGQIQPSQVDGVVTLTGNQTIGGTKTFSSPIVGDITGNAATATNATNANNATTVTNGVYTNTAQTLTGPKRGTVTTDNDLSFDLNTTNNFSCTPTGTGTLTFTNITAGQSGFILLDNSGGHAISAAATTKVGASTLGQISAAGVYLLSYFSNGTDVYVVNSGALA